MPLYDIIIVESAEETCSSESQCQPFKVLNNSTDYFHFKHFFCVVFFWEAESNLLTQFLAMGRAKRFIMENWANKQVAYGYSVLYRMEWN